MTREALLKAMQQHTLQLKGMSDRGAVLKQELLKLNAFDAKWFEESYTKFLIENGLQKPGP